MEVIVEMVVAYEFLRGARIGDALLYFIRWLWEAMWAKQRREIVLSLSHAFSFTQNQDVVV